MNKFLYCFILILLLNQCLFQETECGAEGKNDVPCNERTVSDNLKKCIQTSEGENPLTCSEEYKTCAEASTLTGVDCTKLSTDKILCITGTTGCITPKTCDEVISDATEDICSGFKDNTKKCVFLAKDTAGETNKKAHCKLVACTDSLGDVSTGQEEICSKRSMSEKQICYFDGKSACKEAKKCEDVELLTGNTNLQKTCNAYNKDADAEQKCLADGKRCILKSYCAKGKQAEHECSYYLIKNNGNVCVPKEKSTTDCEEIPQETYEKRLEEEAANVCKDLKGKDCTLTFSNTFFAECKLNGEGDSQKCESNEEYSTCATATALSGATNQQCSKLVHSSDKYCIKGIDGCLEVATCESITGTTLTDAICKNFPAPSNYECVKGEKGCNLVEKKKAGGNNSSQGLTLSFAMLILILVI